MSESHASINTVLSAGRNDGGRFEAARERRKVQVEQWNAYDLKMRNNENTPTNMDRINTSVQFLDKYLLLDAALRNDVADAKRLLREGINPNVAKEDGLTALHQACINGCLELCQVLVASGADVNSRDADQWTPLHAAATCGHVDICKFLISVNANILTANVDGSMPYDIAQDDETAELFLNEIERRKISKADIEAARSLPEKMMIDDLLSMYNRGEDLNTLDSQGAAALHIAAACNYIDVTNLLLRVGVDPDTRDFELWTPAHIAACWGQLEVLKVLIAHGANLDLTTPSGHTAFTLCESTEMHEQLCEIWDDRHTLQARLREECPQPVSRINRRSHSSVHRSSIGDKWKFSRNEVMQEVQMRLNNTISTLDDVNDDKGFREPSMVGNKDSPSLHSKDVVRNIIIVSKDAPSSGINDSVDLSSPSSIQTRNHGRVIQIVHENNPGDSHPSTQTWNQGNYTKGKDIRPSGNNNLTSWDPKAQKEMDVRTRPLVTDHRGDLSQRQSRVNSTVAEEPSKPDDNIHDPNAVQPGLVNHSTRSSQAESSGSTAYSTCCRNCTLV